LNFFGARNLMALEASQKRRWGRVSAPRVDALDPPPWGGNPSLWWCTPSPTSIVLALKDGPELVCFPGKEELPVCSPVGIIILEEE